MHYYHEYWPNKMQNIKEKYSHAVLKNATYFYTEHSFSACNENQWGPGYHGQNNFTMLFIIAVSIEILKINK